MQIPSTIIISYMGIPLGQNPGSATHCLSIHMYLLFLLIGPQAIHYSFFCLRLFPTISYTSYIFLKISLTIIKHHYIFIVSVGTEAGEAALEAFHVAPYLTVAAVVLLVADLLVWRNKGPALGGAGLFPQAKVHLGPAPGPDPFQDRYLGLGLSHLLILPLQSV